MELVLMGISALAGWLLGRNRLVKHLLKMGDGIVKEAASASDDRYALGLLAAMDRLCAVLKKRY